MTGNPAIFVPVTVLAFWTFAVLLLIPLTEIGASRRQAIVDAELRAAAASRAALPNRNLMNLLEVPVLFYVGCLVLYVTGGAGTLAIVLAWVYVALRIVHSVIHLTYNHVAHRGTVFAASSVVIVALWVVVAVHVLAAATALR